MSAAPIARSRFNTNTWNRIRYGLYASVYDWIGSRFERQRRRALQLLDARADERVLIVGAGTGLDLDYLASGPQITAIDLTPSMVRRIRRRAVRRGLEVEARVMDGQALEFPDATFDAAILHLILSVIPDPVRCIRETARVLRRGGRAVIFDKFLPDGAPPPWPFRLLNPVAGFLATEITRQLSPILDQSGLTVTHQEAAAWKGLFKIVLLRRPSGP